MARILVCHEGRRNLLRHRHSTDWPLSRHSESPHQELRDLERKKAAADRKARTHRLVEVGAVLEQAAGMPFDTEELRRALSEVLNEQMADANGNLHTFGELIAGACRTALKRGQSERHDHI